MRALVLGGLFAFAVPAAASAGAWTLPQGRSALFLGATYSRAATGFDRAGTPGASIRYEKTLVQLDAEYGWNDWLTLIFEPEYTHARLARAHQPQDVANDVALVGGVRVRLFDDIGIVSVQVSAKTAGAFDMSVSSTGAPGRQLEVRLLYGTNFTLFGYEGFFDAEAGQRWIAGPRADETPVDLTLGLRILKHTRLMVQNFNIVAQGNARPPFSYFRLHKLSLSVVQDIRPGLCLETSAFITVAGQNALAEKGLGLRLWFRF